jgi:hypothetical protein
LGNRTAPNVKPIEWYGVFLFFEICDFCARAAEKSKVRGEGNVEIWILT